MLESFEYLMSQRIIKMTKEELLSLALSLKMELSKEYEVKIKDMKDNLTNYMIRLKEARESYSDLEYRYNNLQQKYDILYAKNSMPESQEEKSKPKSKYDKLSRELFGGGIND